MDVRLSSIEQVIGAKFAEFESRFQKSNADTAKSVAGIVLAVGAAGLAPMTFQINNITPRPAAAPAPIITLPTAIPVAPPQVPPRQSRARMRAA